MPTCRRKRVLLTEPSPALLDALKSDPNKQVFYLAQTGEIFETYEAYASRISFYRLKQFQCEVTGKSGLDYFQALESERQEGRTMHTRFPDQLKAAVLKAVQWQVIGRLDHLVEAVYDRFKDRYFTDEKVLVDIQGDKFLSRILEVSPPQPAAVPSENGAAPVASSSSAPPSDAPAPIHKIAQDLKLPVKESIALDDPTKYMYKVQILEEERQPGYGRSHDKSKGKEVHRAQWSGQIVTCHCPILSRDRLTFSKSILRRFIRDCVDRDAAVASPWIVKPAIAARFGVSMVMPDEIKKNVDSMKKGETDKRKKVWEDKEGPSAKRQKKMPPPDDKSTMLAAAIEQQRQREAQQRAEQMAKNEALAAEKKKKKPVRYPTEDLDVVIGEKEKKAGMKLKRPVPSREGLPFGTDQLTNDAFIMSWNFLVVYGQPLHVSSFTMDDFEQAMRHSVIEPACPLLAEIHATLIYNMRTVPFTKHSAVVSLMNMKDEMDMDDTGVFGVTIDTLTAAMADVGNNWERAPLRHADGREGWEESLVGCLKDHATVENFPRLREILTKLLFSAEPSAEAPASAAPTPFSSPGPTILTTPTAPGQLYHKLPPRDRIAIISFMCNLAVSSKAIHAHMEWCEEQLTALRKEKIEVNRSRKQYAEEIHTLEVTTKEAQEAAAAANGNSATNGTSASAANGVTEGDVPMHDSSDLSEAPNSDGEPDGGSASARRRQNTAASSVSASATRRSAAKHRELARAQAASAKQALADKRRLEEEVNKIERRLEGIEREFRKLLGAVRVKALGRDRFYNRIWWFDGMGAASLVGSGGTVQYGTGRIFVQGPSEFDVEVLTRRKENVDARRRLEEGEEGMLAVGEWAVYNDLDELNEFLAWLNPKGVRELALKNAFVKWWSHIQPGMRRRAADLTTNAKITEARRSTRKHGGHDISRESYMQWTNRKAVNGS